MQSFHFVDVCGNFLEVRGVENKLIDTASCSLWSQNDLISSVMSLPAGAKSLQLRIWGDLILSVMSAEIGEKYFWSYIIDLLSKSVKDLQGIFINWQSIILNVLVMSQFGYTS